MAVGTRLFSNWVKAIKTNTFLFSLIKTPDNEVRIAGLILDQI